MAVHLDGFDWSDPVPLPSPLAPDNVDEEGEATIAAIPVPAGAASSASTPTESQQQRWRKRLGGGRGGGWSVTGRRVGEAAAINVEVELKDSRDEGSSLIVNAEIAFSACGLRKVRISYDCAYFFSVFATDLRLVAMQGQ